MGYVRDEADDGIREGTLVGTWIREESGYPVKAARWEFAVRLGLVV